MATTLTDPKSGTNHKHGLTATDAQIAALKKSFDDKLEAVVKTTDERFASLEARVTKLEGVQPPIEPPVDPPDPPGPLPVGTTPPKAVRDIAAAGGDATAAVMDVAQTASPPRRSSTGTT